MAYFAKVQLTKMTPAETVLKKGSECSKCGNCCSKSAGFICDSERPAIAQYFRMPVNEFTDKYLDEIDLFNTKAYKPKLVRENNKLPFGRCVFLAKENNCLLQPIKPIHCRIGNCSESGEQLNQWFLLNFCVNPQDPQSIRDWAHFLEHNQTIPGGELKEIVPDAVKLKQILSYEILR